MSILELTDNVSNSYGSMEHTDTPSSDEVVLACMTYPASKNSNRLARILRTLSTVGRVSLESPEEQDCDIMRARIALFINRVTSLLDEPKRGPVYLIGFGVGGLVMLLSVVHMHSTGSGTAYLDSTTHRRRWGANGLAGLICIGLPLRGLKGPRGVTDEIGGTGDPLLNLPNIPILLVVGAASRLGGPQDVYRFRRKLLASRTRRRCQPVSMETGCHGVQMVVVGAGADHLLRLRNTTCFRWGITQETVDRRIVGAVRRFICTVERSFSRYGSGRRPQSLPPILDPVSQADITTGSPYSQTQSPSASPAHPPLTGNVPHFSTSATTAASAGGSVDASGSRPIGRRKLTSLPEETHPILLVASSSSSNLSSSTTSSPLTDENNGHRRRGTCYSRLDRPSPTAFYAQSA